MWTSTKFNHMMPLGSILAPPLGSQDGNWEQSRPTSKFFLSETFWLVYSLRVHIFSPIIMKVVQNVCYDEILDEFENGSCRVKKLGHKFKS